MPERFLDRLEVSRTAKARPIGLPPVAVFHLDEDFFISSQNKCDQEENGQDVPQDRKPTLNGTGVRKASARADSNEYEGVRDSGAIERKSHRTD